MDTRSIQNFFQNKKKESQSSLPISAIYMEDYYPTSYFKNDSNYQENLASPANKAVYFGSRQDLYIYYDDLEKLKEKSSYYGRVFFPENEMLRKEKWTYAKNMAFWAAVIDRNQPLVLVTDIKYYPKIEKGKKKLTGTISEILWLVDNGYTLSVNMSNPKETAFVPPTIQKTEKKLVNYIKNDRRDTFNYFNNVKNEFLTKKYQAASKTVSKRPAEKNLENKKKFGIPKKQPRVYYYHPTSFISDAQPVDMIVDNTDTTLINENTNTVKLDNTSNKTCPPLFFKFKINLERYNQMKLLEDNRSNTEITISPFNSL